MQDAAPPDGGPGSGPDGGPDGGHGAIAVISDDEDEGLLPSELQELDAELGLEELDDNETAEKAAASQVALHAEPQEVAASQLALAEPEEVAASQLVEAEPEEVAASQLAHAEPEEVAASQLAPHAEPEEVAASQLAHAEPQEVAASQLAHAEPREVAASQLAHAEPREVAASQPAHAEPQEVAASQLAHAVPEQVAALQLAVDAEMCDDGEDSQAIPDMLNIKSTRKNLAAEFQIVEDSPEHKTPVNAKTLLPKEHMFEETCGTMDPEFKKLTEKIRVLKERQAERPCS